MKGGGKIMEHNFIFNGVSSETYGVMCVYFGSASDTYSAGIQTDLETEYNVRKKSFDIISHKYSAPLSFKIQIINKDGSKIDSDQERQLKNWLCVQGTYKELQFDDAELYGIKYNVIFTNPQVIVIGRTMGLEFTVTADTPWGYSPDIIKRVTLAANGSFILNIQSDENSYIYPYLTIKILEAGNFTLTNSTEQEKKIFTVNNCAVNEVLTVDCSIPYIETTISSHSVYSDFSKYFIRLINGKNKLTTNLPCEIMVKYNEVRKVGVH